MNRSMNPPCAPACNGKNQSTMAWPNGRRCSSDKGLA